MLAGTECPLLLADTSWLATPPPFLFHLQASKALDAQFGHILCIDGSVHDTQYLQLCFKAVSCASKV